jgi:hypothetical protein
MMRVARSMRRAFQHHYAVNPLEGDNGGNLAGQCHEVAMSD